MLTFNKKVPAKWWSPEVVCWSYILLYNRH